MELAVSSRTLNPERQRDKGMRSFVVSPLEPDEGFKAPGAVTERTLAQLAPQARPLTGS